MRKTSNKVLNLTCTAALFLRLNATLPQNNRLRSGKLARRYVPMEIDYKFRVLTTIIGALAWIFFAIFYYCTSTNIFYQNHDSYYFLIGSKAIILSAVTAGVSAIFSTFLLINSKKNKHNYINIGISYPIATFFIFMYLVVKITGGA